MPNTFIASKARTPLKADRMDTQVLGRYPIKLNRFSQITGVQRIPPLRLVTAEGVETPGQLAFLDVHRCASFQGFYFSKPVPAADFGAMLAQAAAGIAPTPASA